MVKVSKIELKLTLKKAVGGTKYIHYPDLTPEQDKQLFEDIIAAVVRSFDRAYYESEEILKR